MTERKLTPEQELFFTLAAGRIKDRERFRELTGQPVHWPELLGQLMFHRVCGMAFHALAESGCQCPSDQTQFALRMVHQAQSLRTQSMRESIVEIAGALNRDEIPYAMLKGSILANTVYPPGTRVSNDVDILVQAEHITRIGKTLEQMGFIQGRYNPVTRQLEKASRADVIHRRINWGEVVPYVKILDRPGIDVLEVDINFSVDWLPVSTKKAVAMMMERRQACMIGETPVFSLDPEDFLVHLLMHMYKELILLVSVICLRDLEFYKFVDILQFTGAYRERLDRDRFLDKCGTYGLQQGCYVALRYVGRFYPDFAEDPYISYITGRLAECGACFDDTVIDPPTGSRFRWREDALQRLFDCSRHLKLESLTL